ncbi:hypothetical protein GA0115246_1043413 [Streptomyces sp. SolWspMP-sol7th]|nr:hypothetical protein GA0115246_1043413 [Streptomyces sp. SolWspMP-sol7th]
MRTRTTVAGVFDGGVENQSGQVDDGGSAFLHPVGVDDEAVAGAAVEVLDAVRGGRGEPEGGVHLQGHAVYFAVAQAQGPGVTGVDEPGAGAVEGEAHQQAGGEAALWPAQEGPVGLPGLFGQVGTGAAGTAGGVDGEGGQQGGFGVMAHGVGDRHVQGVGVEGVVVGVAGHGVGRYQRAGERELGRLAGGSGGQELALDLGCQGDRGGAPAPVVEVGEAAVGDDDVGQRVRGLLHLLQHLIGDLGQEQLQDPDGVAPVGDRSEHPLSGTPVGRPDEPLGAQHFVVDAAHERDLVRPAPPPGVGLPDDAHHLPAGHVHEQERHVPRAETTPQVAGHHVERSHRRGVLRGGQHLGKPKPIISHHDLLECPALFPVQP